MIQKQNSYRAGFTLLELMLALGLSVILVGLLGTAINMFLLDLDRERDDLTRARAARAVLQVMADDFRAAIQYKELDTTALDEAIASAQAAMGTEEEEEEATEEEEPVVVEHPGLAGGPNSISLDISRLPRRDQYTISYSAENNVISIPSEIRNVNYKVGTVANNDGGSRGSRGNEETGLLRMEYDRAAKRFADLGGGKMPSYEMLAAEVKQLTFQYFDGENWSDEWDSNELKTMPVAIEIKIMVDPRSEEYRQMQRQAGDSDANFALQEYSTVVFVPLAESVAAMQAREELKNYVE